MISDDELEELAAEIGATLHEEADPLGRAIDPDKLLAEGWVYREISWCSASVWANIMKKLGGQENYVTLARSVRPSGDTRGQLLISPQGIHNLKKSVAN